jgi:hypothetical protein
MSFAMSCPECDAELEIPDTLAGKTLRCRKCQGTFRAKAPAGDDDDVPAPRTAGGKRSGRPRDEDSDRPRKPAGKKKRKPKPKSPLPLVLGLAGGLVVSAGLGVGIAYFAGAFDSGTKSAKGAAADRGGRSGTGLAAPNDLKLGNPPRQVAQQARLTAVAQRTDNGVQLKIEYEFLADRDPNVEYVMVSVHADGNSVNFLDDRSRGALYQDVPAGRQEFWIARRKLGSNLMDPGDRVSNVATYNG